MRTSSGIIINHSAFRTDYDTLSERQVTQQEVLNNYPGIFPTYYTHLNLDVEELIPTRCYNCWGFTFDPRQCWISTGQDVQNILDDNGTPVADGSIEPGDVICYRRNGGITHTGRVWTVDDSGHAILIRSKWGGWGEYLHPPLIVPVTYGTDISYWKCTSLQGRTNLFIKDSNDDDGSQYSPSPFWVSPDIWVDNNLDGNPDDNPLAGRVNHVYARIRNEGSQPINNVEIKFYWADPSGGIPPTGWNLIGNYIIPNLAAYSNIRAGPVSWTPQALPEHQCLLVIANGGDSIIDSGESDPIVYPFNVRWENCISMKNVTVIILSGGRSILVSQFVQLTPNLFWDVRKIPKRIDIDFELLYDASEDYKKIKDVIILMKEENKYIVPLFKPFTKKRLFESGLKMDLELPQQVFFKEFDSKLILRRSIKSIELKPKEKIEIKLRIGVPEDAKPGSKYTLNIIQSVDGIITGGYTYIINITK